LEKNIFGGKHMAYTRNKKSGIHHVSLRVPDLKKAVDFYIQGLDAALVVEWGQDGEAGYCTYTG
jgi:catechol 2,3-dioxygenase-like lactoylglutathione lyase family enzyme